MPFKKENAVEDTGDETEGHAVKFRGVAEDDPGDDTEGHGRRLPPADEDTEGHVQPPRTPRDDPDGTEAHIIRGKP